MQIDWPHIITEGTIYLAPTLGLGYLGYKKLLWTLTEHRPHTHVEDDGFEESRETPLAVKGLRYPRNGKSRS
jgi:hypothetical protein